MPIKTSGNPRLLNVNGAETPLQVSAADFDIDRHNAVVTIEHDGQHRTFMIRTVQIGEKFGRPGQRLASLLIAPDRDNPRNWDNFGFVAPGGVVQVFNNRKGENKRSPHEYYALMLMNPTAWEAKGYVYLMMGFCKRCNRPLTVPQSLRDGLGPICRKKAA